MIVRALSEISQHSITDDVGRSFQTLRISLTNQCNLACTYCVPEKHKNASLPLKRLSTGEYLEAVRKIHALTNLQTVRLTGGEPLLYKEIIGLIEGIRKLGISSIKLTTNGVFLSEMAHDLKKAGLNSVNVSLDGLTEDTFNKVSRRKNVNQVLEGISKVVEAGLDVKLNTVVMKGVNDHELVPLLQFAIQKGVVVRFLELMNMGHMSADHVRYFVSEEEMLSILSKQFKFYPLEREASATSKYWITDNLKRFGIISNISDSFCSDCNRLRLDSFGRIFGCLSSTKAIPIIDSLNDDSELERRLREALTQKQVGFTGSSTSMKSIGG